MKLRKKFGIILGIFSIVFGLIMFEVLVKHYSEHYAERLNWEYKRLENAYWYKNNIEKKVLNDWAMWDDSYKFIEKPNQEYIDSNLGWETFENLDINYMVYMDKEYNVVYSKYFKNEEKKLVDVPENLLKKIQNFREDGDIILKDDGTPIVGFIRGIVDSHGVMDANGFLFMGWEFSENLISGMVNDLQIPLDIKFLKKSGNDAMGLVKYMSFKVSDGEDFFVKFSVKPEVKKEIRATSAKVLGVLLLFFTFTGLGFSRTMNTLVFSKLEKFSSDVTIMSEKEEFDRELHWDGDDEIGKLKSAVNNLKNKLDLERRNYRNLYHSSSAINIVLDKNLTVKHASKTFKKLSGYSEREIYETSFLDILLGDKNLVEKKLLTFFKDGVGNKLKINLETKNKRKFNFLVTASKINSPKTYEEMLLLTGIDVTDLNQLREKIREYFTYDKLTDAYNRESGLRMLAEILEKDGQLSVAVLDVSGLKDVNVVYGQAEGDRLIKDFSEILKHNIRQSDIVCRLGGGEFLVGFPRKDSSLVGKFLNRIESEVESFNWSKKRKYRISFCRGYVECEAGIGIDELIKSAQRRLDLDKKSRVHDFKEERMLRDLKEAIAQEQFIVYYQPKLNFENRARIGVEALVRWEHPELGIVQPGEFIPLAEKYGLMGEISKIVIEKSCRDASEMKEKFAISLAVNISPQQFKDNKFVDDIKKLVSKNCKTCILELEITENTVMEDVDVSIGKMNELIEEGVSFSIDDFGTGYSSLSYLKKMPVSKIKIDRSFVMGMLEDKHKKVIVRTIISLARELELDIVAEGVETVGQLKLLYEMGCRVFQGFLFDRPIPKEVLMRKVEDGEYLKKMDEALGTK